MEHEILALLTKEESPTLEFKRQWYWDNSTPAAEMPRKWGELIKDIISLANGYINNTGETRYLIFGFCEKEQKTFDIKLSEIRQLRDIPSFRKDLIERLEKLTKPSLLNINIKTHSINSETLLIFEIPCPTHLTELKKELQTKTRHLDEGAILVRKGQKTDEIRTATPEEIENLKLEFEKYRESSLYKKMNPEPQPSPTEKSIEKTVQLFIDKNSSYSLSNNFPVKEKDWKECIIYEVYKLQDGFSSTKDFIYIHDLSNQGKTLADIKKKRIIHNFESAIVLIDRPKSIDDARRKSNIQKLFNSNYVFFIDEFGHEHLYKDCILPYEKFKLPVYVDSLYDEGNNIDLPALTRLQKWFDSDNEPLFVVSGHGGIGKTTLAKQFLDWVSEKNAEAGILFIDSKDIISELSRSFSIDNKISDVFDFYKALMDADDIEGARFDKDSLQLSIDNGSLVVVLDGIDEVIAKLGEKFDVERFITSIFEEYSSGLHKTKVLITCRDHFWNQVSKKILLPEITLKAFNNELTKEFFAQKFKNDKKKIDKAMVMAEDLAVETLQGTSSVIYKTYIPFLLDMIAYLIKSQNTQKSTQDSFQSKYLTKHDNTDQLIALVCQREIAKLGTLSIDQQIELFIKIALNKQNEISLYNIKEELQKITPDFNDSLIEKIQGHSLLQSENNKIYFRYDVFETYFKALLVHHFFKQRDISLLREELTVVISGYLKYDSSFTEAVAKKLTISDDLIIFCIETIESAQKTQGINREIFISSIVSLLLTTLKTDQKTQWNLTSRTKILYDLFFDATQNCLTGVCLVDIFGATSYKPTFDFRGTTLKNCIFNNYEYFWECNIDKKTKFIESTFKDIDPRAGISYDIPEGLFSQSCDLTSIQHLLSEKKDAYRNSQEEVTADLEKVFRLFYQRGNFYPRKQEEVRKKLSAVKLLQELIDRGVIKNYVDQKKPTMKQYKISDEYKSVIDYIEQQSPSHEFELLVDNLLEVHKI